MDRIYFTLGENVCYISATVEDDDVWRAIDMYDTANGTDLWDRLDERSVLGVNLDEYPDAIEVTRIVEETVRRDDAVTLVENARRMEAWDGDGEDDSRWYAVQPGITADGWPFHVRYAFPAGYEPESDEDLMEHVQRAVVVQPADLPKDGPTETTSIKAIAANGNGLMVSVTREARLLGLDRGDMVEITIRRKD